jgi:anti-anti-sigma factor
MISPEISQEERKVKEDEYNTILLVDDDLLILKALDETLSREGYKILKANDGFQAVDILRNQPVALIICDQRMPGMTGIEVMKQAQVIHPEAIRIILTGNVDLETVLQCINEGQVSQFILKPWEPALLIQTVAASLEKYRLLKENLNLNAITREQHEKLTKTHEILRHELVLGARIHETMLLGKVPKNIPGFFIEVMTIPSKEIDGDFFEFYRPSFQTLDVVLGDVMGKGIPAALVGTAIKTQFMRFAVPFTHVQVYHRDEGWEEDLLSPAEILANVHQEIVPQLIHLEYFASIFYGRFLLQKRTLEFVDCGSTKPLHFRCKDKTCVMLVGHNFPLGTVEIETYYTEEISYMKGDFFIFYSDGLTEAMSPEKQLYGHERLIELVKANSEVYPHELLEIIKKSVTSFTGKSTFDDDFTVIIMKAETADTFTQTRLSTAKFHADLSQVKAVRDFVDRFCKQAPGDKGRLARELQLAINEAFCNIVKHGYKNEQERIVLIEARLDEEGVFVELSDQSQGFNPADIQHPSLAGDQDNGYGWYLIREIVDQITYIRKESAKGWNHLQIFKRYHQEGRKMQFEHETKDNVLIIVPEGESLDAQDAPEFKEKVLGLIQTNSTNQVVLDIHLLQFIDSSGLGSLLSVLRLLHNSGGELKLACMNKPVRTMFELVSMHKIFEIFNNTDDAVKSFQTKIKRE